MSGFEKRMGRGNLDVILWRDCSAVKGNNLILSKVEGKSLSSKVRR